MNWEIECKRMQRKLAKKDRKINALELRIKKLEIAVADRSINLTRTIEKSFESCLANVRMVPIIGIRSSDKIVEFSVKDKGEQ